MKKLILFCLILIIVSKSFSEESMESIIQNQKPDDKTMVEFTSENKYEFGATLSFDLDYGLNFGKIFKENWLFQIAGDIQNPRRYRYSGGNPNSQVPYGYELKDVERKQMTINLFRQYQPGAWSNWSIFAGVGFGISLTKANVEFYNPWIIGYDKNSPAGSDSVSHSQVSVPAFFGFRNAHLFGDNAFVNILLELPLVGNEEIIFRSPKGTAVKDEHLNRHGGSIKTQFGARF